MTVALASAVDALDLPAPQGVSARAVRVVLRYMARIASSTGEFQWGMGLAKVSERTDYSVATVKRAQAYLVDQGLLERVRVGGGRAKTHWRVLVDKLVPPEPRAGRPAEPSQETARSEPGQSHAPGFVRKALSWKPPVIASSPPAWRPGVRVQTCEHGGSPGLLPSGVPRCPMCRRRP